MLGQKPSKEIATIAEGFIFFLAAVGGGRSHCIAVERVCGFSVILAFALQGLARFVCIENPLRQTCRYNCKQKQNRKKKTKCRQRGNHRFPEGTVGLEGWSERRSRA